MRKIPKTDAQINMKWVPLQRNAHHFVRRTIKKWNEWKSLTTGTHHTRAYKPIITIYDLKKYSVQEVKEKMKEQRILTMDLSSFRWVIGGCFFHLRWCLRFYDLANQRFSHRRCRSATSFLASVICLPIGASIEENRDVLGRCTVTDSVTLNVRDATLPVDTVLLIVNA